LSEQSLLQVPSMGLQHVVALQTTEPLLTVYEHEAPAEAQVPVVP
jgi:hypothetical protein